MGFGSYDESEQEQANDNDEVEGEDMTADFKSEVHDGTDSVANDSTDEMMGHL